MSPELLKKSLDQHNRFSLTDFELIEAIHDELCFCKIRVTKYKIEDLFNLGHRLSVIEHLAKEKGEIDW